MPLPPRPGLRLRVRADALRVMSAFRMAALTVLPAVLAVGCGRDPFIGTWSSPSGMGARELG